MSARMSLPLFEYTDFHQTNTHLYIFGYTSIDRRGKLLVVNRTNATPLDVQCENFEFSLDDYQRKLQLLQEENSSNGGLQPVCKVAVHSSRTLWAR
jgi:hypothetical protein